MNPDGCTINIEICFYFVTESRKISLLNPVNLETQICIHKLTVPKLLSGSAHGARAHARTSIVQQMAV